MKRFPPPIWAAAAVLVIGCSGSEKSTESNQPNRELSLEHFIEGSLLDQKGEFAKAILEYQDALRLDRDAAIYHALAKDYSILGKHALAAEMGREAVKLKPRDQAYHETLAEIYGDAYDFENAIKEYEEIIRLDSQYVRAWHSLARLMQINKPLEALRIYEELIDRFGPDWDAYYQMAQIYGATGKLSKATESLKGMLELDPSSFEIRKALGDMYLRQDSVDAALSLYGELVELHPENLELRAAIAHSYLLKQDYEHARKQFESVLTKDTLTADEQVRFGQIFVSFIEKDSAVAPYALSLFERIRDAYPSDWRPYWFIGAISSVSGDDSTALGNFQKVKELASWNPDGWVRIASIYYDRNQFAEAIQVLTEAKKAIPEEFRIHFLLGIAYQREQRPVDAALSLEKALQLNDKSVDAMSALGLVYDELKRPAESDSMYERALRINPHNHLVLNNYGYSLADRGLELDRALKMAKEATALQPANQSYLDTYGWVLFRLGKYEEAEQHIRKAVELGSTSPVIYEHLGDVYFKLSRIDKALEFWNKALKINSKNASLKEKIERGSL